METSVKTLTFNVCINKCTSGTSAHNEVILWVLGCNDEKGVFLLYRTLQKVEITIVTMLTIQSIIKPTLL